MIIEKRQCKQCGEVTDEYVDSYFDICMRCQEKNRVRWYSERLRARGIVEIPKTSEELEKLYDKVKKEDSEK